MKLDFIMSKSTDRPPIPLGQEHLESTSYSRSLIYAEYAYGREYLASASSSKLEESFDAEMSVEHEVVKIKVPSTYSTDNDKGACELIAETAIADIAVRTLRSLGKEVHFAWPSSFSVYEGNTSATPTSAQFHRGISHLYTSCGSSSEVFPLKPVQDEEDRYCVVLKRGLVEESKSPLGDRAFNLYSRQNEIDFREFFKTAYSTNALGEKADEQVARGKDSACLPECPVPADVLRVWIILNKSLGGNYDNSAGIDPFGYCEAMRRGGRPLCWKGQVSLLDSLLREKIVLLIHRVLHLADRMMMACISHKDQKSREKLYFTTEEILAEYGPNGTRCSETKVLPGDSLGLDETESDEGPLKIPSTCTSRGVNVFDTEAVLAHIKRCSGTCSYAEVLDVVSTQATCLMGLLDAEQPWSRCHEEALQRYDSRSNPSTMWSKRSQAVMYFLLDGLQFMMHIVAPYMPVLAGAMHRVYLAEGFISNGGKVNLSILLSNEWMPRVTEQDEFMWTLPSFKPIMGNLRLPMSLWSGTQEMTHQSGYNVNIVTNLNLFDVKVRAREKDKHEFGQVHLPRAIDIEPAARLENNGRLWKCNYIPRTRVEQSRALLLRHGIVYASLGCKVSKRESTKVCYNIHATGHLLNTSFDNCTFPYLYVKEKEVRMTFRSKCVNIEEVYEGKKSLLDDGLRYVHVGRIAQEEWHDYNKERKIEIVASTHRHLLKYHSKEKKGAKVPAKTCSDKQTIPAVTAHMTYFKQQRTRTVLFSGLDLLPVAEPFKPFMLARKEAARTLSWNLTGYAIAMCTDLETCMTGRLMHLFPYNRNRTSPHDMEALRALVAEVLVPCDETSLLTLEDSEYEPRPFAPWDTDWSFTLNLSKSLPLRIHLQSVKPCMDVSLLLSLSLIDCGLTDTTLISIFNAEGTLLKSAKSKPRTSILLQCLRKLNLSRNELTSEGIATLLAIEYTHLTDSDKPGDRSAPHGLDEFDPWGLRGLRELDLSYNRLLDVYVEEGAAVKGEPSASKVVDLVMTLPLVFRHLEQLNLAGNLLGGLPSDLAHVPNKTGVPYGLIYSGGNGGKAEGKVQDIPTSIANSVASAMYTRARIVAKYDRFLHKNADFTAEDVWKPPFLSVNLNDNYFPNDRLPFRRLLSVIQGTYKPNDERRSTEEAEVDTFLRRPLPVSVLGTVGCDVSTFSPSSSSRNGIMYRVPEEIPSSNCSVRLKHYPHGQTASTLVEKMRKENLYNYLRREQGRGAGSGDMQQGELCVYNPSLPQDSNALNSNSRYRQYWTNHSYHQKFDQNVELRQEVFGDDWHCLPFTEVVDSSSSVPTSSNGITSAEQGPGSIFTAHKYTQAAALATVTQQNVLRHSGLQPGMCLFFGIDPLFGTSSRLTTIDLSGNAIGDDGVLNMVRSTTIHARKIAHAPELKRLILRDIEMTTIAVSGLIEFLSTRRVQQLDVSGNRGIGPLGATLLLEFCCLPPRRKHKRNDRLDFPHGSHLEVLIMSDINLATIPPFQGGLRNTAHPTHDTTFSTMPPAELYRFSTTKRLCESITDVMAVGESVLYSLDVSNNELDSDTLIAFQLAACTSKSVVHLKLGNTQLTKEVAFDVLPGLLASAECNLQALDVSRNQMCGVRQTSFDPRPVHSFAELLAKNRSLQYLNLSGSDIGARSTRKLFEALRGSSQGDVVSPLRALKLDNCNCSEDGGEHVGESLPDLLYLQHLSLSGCMIGPIGCQRLFLGIAQNSSLRYLDVSGNQLSTYHTQNNYALAPIKAIAEGLAANKVLRWVDLSRNGLFGSFYDTQSESDDSYAPEAVHILANGLVDNGNNGGVLTTVNLSGNRLGSVMPDVCEDCRLPYSHVHNDLLPDCFPECTVQAPVSHLLHAMKTHPHLRSLLGVTPSVQHLQLSGLRICDQWLRLIIQEVHNHQNLRSIDLGTNGFSPRGARALARALETNVSLHHLYLPRLVYLNRLEKASHISSSVTETYLQEKIREAKIKATKHRFFLAMLVRSMSDMGQLPCTTMLEFLVGEGPIVKKFIRYRRENDTRIKRSSL